MLIDFHIHLFPDALAAKTLPALSKTAGGAPYHTDGTLVGTLSKMHKWGVDAAVAMHIATSPKSQHNVNTFAAQAQAGPLYCFGSVHPDAPDALEELQRIRDLGLKGVKFHPDYQNFFVDEDRMAPVYSALETLGLPVAFHAGWDPLSPTVVHAPPQALRDVVLSHPKLTVIAAHLGGMRRYGEVEKYLVGLPLYLDTAMSAPYLSDPVQAARIIRGHGVDKILFATDCPWSTPADELTLLEQAGLTAQELTQITHQNAQRLLAIDSAP